MSVEEFTDQYTGNPKFNGNGQVETYSPYVEQLKGQNPKTIWTVIDGEDGKLYLVAGCHFVNRILYFVSNEEWKDENEEYLW